MILRKPYAFLIKHFRLLHAIITVCMVYLTYRTYKIYSYLSDYIRSGSLKVEKVDIDLIFNKTMFILPIVILLVLLILLIVMIRKHKPKTFYFANIIVYSVTLAIYLYIQTNLNEMQFVIVSSQLVKLLKDFSEMVIIAQLITSALCLIRAIGLDLNKFDFNKDLLELDIDDVDNEEFEVSVEVESSDVTRVFKRRMRFLRYFYVENRTKIRLLLVLVVVLTGITIGLNFVKRTDVLKQHKPFTVGRMTASVTNAYLIKNDYLGNSIFEKDTRRLIVITLKARSTKKNDTINTAKTVLVIGKNTYYPTTEYNKEISDLGTVYANQKLTNEYKSYTLVYEVPKSEVERTIRFKFLSSIDTSKKKAQASYVSINLHLNNIDKITNVEDREIGKIVKLNNEVLKKTVLRIDNMKIDDTFVNKYLFCLEEEECINSVEYIVPTLNSTQDKKVLQIDAKFVLDEEIENPLATNLGTLISNFAKISYVLDGKAYTVNSLENLKYSKSPKDNIAYFEVPKEIYNAEDIVFRIKIRNQEYRYKIEL